MKRRIYAWLLLAGMFFLGSVSLCAEVPDVGPSGSTGVWSDEEGNNYYE